MTSQPSNIIVLPVVIHWSQFIRTIIIQFIETFSDVIWRDKTQCQQHLSEHPDVFVVTIVTDQAFVLDPAPQRLSEVKQAASNGDMWKNGGRCL